MIDDEVGCLIDVESVEVCLVDGLCCIVGCGVLCGNFVEVCCV